MWPRVANKKTRARRAFCLCLVVILSTGALPTIAQDPDSVVIKRKSPRHALLYSLGGTLGPFAGTMVLAASYPDPPPRDWELYLLRATGGLLFFGGWTVGPSLGHFYAEAPGRAWTGIGIRTTGLAVSVLGQAWYRARTTRADREDGASLLGILGAVLTTGSAAYDILRAPQSARDFNRKNNVHVQVAPTVHPSGEQAGLSLRVAF